MPFPCFLYGQAFPTIEYTFIKYIPIAVARAKASPAAARGSVRMEVAERHLNMFFGLLI